LFDLYRSPDIVTVVKDTDCNEVTSYCSSTPWETFEVLADIALECEVDG
jgi:hypothetical protein